MHRRLTLSMILFFCVVASARAEGNLAARAERLPTLMLDAAEGFSIKTYEIETGRFYRWRIVSDGREEYKLQAPELFRNAWIEQIVIADKEVKPYGGIYALEFDDAGEIDVYFLVIRPGNYRFYIEALRTQGFEGIFNVK